MAGKTSCATLPIHSIPESRNHLDLTALLQCFARTCWGRAAAARVFRCEAPPWLDAVWNCEYFFVLYFSSFHVLLSSSTDSIIQIIHYLSAVTERLLKATQCLPLAREPLSGTSGSLGLGIQKNLHSSRLMRVCHGHRPQSLGVAEEIKPCSYRTEKGSHATVLRSTRMPHGPHPSTQALPLPPRHARRKAASGALAEVLAVLRRRRNSSRGERPRVRGERLRVTLAAPFSSGKHVCEGVDKNGITKRYRDGQTGGSCEIR